jgi:hypothetical protein
VNETPQELVARLKGQKFDDVYEQFGAEEWREHWPVVDGESRLTGEAIPLHDKTKDWRLTVGEGGCGLKIEAAEARAHGWIVGEIVARPA